MRVTCNTDETIRDGDYLRNDGSRVQVNSTVVECSRCLHETFAFGTSDASVRRCLALMREECPEGENNFYTLDD